VAGADNMLMEKSTCIYMRGQQQVMTIGKRRQGGVSKKQAQQEHVTTKSIFYFLVETMDP